MCGIAGVVHLGGGAPPFGVVERMNAVLAHRGPDGEGVLPAGPAVFGHRRLAIIDLSPRSAQPMRLERPEGPLVLTYNGEVYNYLELRSELEGLGEVFTSEGDTEVVLRAYARWGLEAFARFNGMWGLALWDGARGRLVLSRDRFGIKPLYWRRAGDLLWFASEIKALLVADPEARAVDEGVLGRFLQSGVQDAGPRTFYRDVYQVEPGRALSFELPGGRRVTHTYWELEQARVATPADPAAALRSLLDDAVGLRLRSDVPVGTCLSGGLDSSSVLALAARRTPLDTSTFTAVYSDQGYDESEFAQAMVERYGCAPHETRPRPGAGLVDVVDRLGWFHDEPCSRPGLVTQHYVMQRAAGQVKVLLDGQGGDELLGGYAYYALPYLRSLLGRALAQGLRLALWRKLLGDARGLLALPSTSAEGHGSLLRLLGRAAVRRLGRGAPPAVSEDLRLAARALEAETPPLFPRRDTPFDALLLEDLTRRSIPALLHHEDRTSMSCSLEARVPFLDHRLVELAMALPLTEKIDGAWTKAVLRRAVADLLPPQVTWRTDKLGYPTPIHRWLDEGRAGVEEALLGGFARRGLIEPGGVERAWAEHQSGTGRGDPWLLFRWLTTELWLRRSVEADPGLGPPSVGGA